MNVLVAGSEGSLMQAVIPMLLQKGNSVIGVDSCFRYGRVDRERKYRFIEGDLSDGRFVNQILTDDIDVILQAAARIFGVMGFHSYAADILGRDVALHHNILNRAKDLSAIKRVVY